MAADFVAAIAGFSNELSAERLFEQAEFARREALAAVRTHWDDDSAAVAGLLYRTGRALLYQGKTHDAEQVLREGITRAREIDDYEILSRNQINLAETMVHLGRYQKASAIAVEVIDRYRHEEDQSSGSTFNEKLLTMEARRMLGIAKLGLNDTRTAESLLHEAAGWFTRSQSWYSWRCARARSAWGACLVSLRSFEKAEPILLQSQKILETEVGLDSTATLDANRRIVRLYKAWGKPALAAKWAKFNR